MKELKIDKSTASRKYQRRRLYGTPSNRKRFSSIPIFDKYLAPLPRSLANVKRESRRKSGLRHGSGLEAGSPRPNTGCQRDAGRTTGWLGAPRRSPRGTISRKRGMPALDNTCTGPRRAPRPSAGGADAPRKQETTSSRCVRNGRCSRKFCGQRC